MTFYAVDIVGCPDRHTSHQALSAWGVRKLGPPMRIELTDDTICTLEEISADELPPAWREMFRGYFWRQRG